MLELRDFQAGKIFPAMARTETSLSKPVAGSSYGKFQANIGRLIAVTKNTQFTIYCCWSQKYIHHVKINSKFFKFYCKAIQSDLNLYLCCTDDTCLGSGTIQPKLNVFENKIFSIQDFCALGAANLDNYFCDSFQIVTGHTCQGVDSKNSRYL